MDRSFADIKASAQALVDRAVGLSRSAALSSVDAPEAVLDLELAEDRIEREARLQSTSGELSLRELARQQMELGRALRHLKDRGDWAIGFADRLGKMASTIARFPKPKDLNTIGLDLAPELIDELQRVLAGGRCESDYKEAQLRELAFWRWVAFEGYLGDDPRLYEFHHEQLMVGTFLKTGWPLSDLKNLRLVEIGCGPLGMINFLPSREAVGYDPLNLHYDILFRNPRAGKSILYVDDDGYFSDKDQSFDLAICHNVLDHTLDPDRIFNMFAGLIRDGGRFIVQVNTVRADVPRTAEHEAMHPSPLTVEQMREWIGQMSDDFERYLSDEPSPDGEFYFIAWGRKTRTPAAVYHRAKATAGVAPDQRAATT